MYAGAGRYSATLSLIAAVAVGSGCSGACQSESSAIARVVAHTGTVDKDVGDGFQLVEGDDHLACDHRLRTGERSTATLAFTAGGTFRVQTSTLITLSCDGRPGMTVAFGEVEIEGAVDDLSLELEIGTVQLSGKGRYRVRRDRFEVVVGNARIRRKDGDGASDALAAGEGLTWEIGAATVRKIANRLSDRSDAGVVDAMSTPGDALVGDASADAALELVISGRKAERQAPGESGWKRLSKGNHPGTPGSRIRISKRTKVQIARGAERATITGPAQFVIGRPGNHLVSTERGKITVHSIETPVTIEVPGGVIIARNRPGDGSRARIDVSKRATDVRVNAGAIDVTSDPGGEETLRIGERLTLGHDGSMTVTMRAPKVADFEVPAGESSTIHDPSPPTSVRVRFEDECAGDGVVDVSSRSSFRGRLVQTSGTGSVNLRVKRGTLHYRVRCIDDGVLSAKASARGTLRVVKDKAMRPLPKHAATSTVDADGRRYRVMYQNRLPSITFRWPTAAKSGSYTFRLRHPNGKTISKTVRVPSYNMSAGRLSEGTYQYHFESDGKRSKTSSLTIEFDNVAPSTHLRSPGVGHKWPSDGVKIRGAALRGAKVSVGDTGISVDSHGRFSTTVNIADEQTSLAVRVAIRKQGVHYYVRRTR